MNQILSDISSVTETCRAMLPSLSRKKTITTSDVVALRTAELDVGLVSRDQAEQMFAIERGAARKCRAWGDLLVEAVLDFVVWGERPTGRLSEENASWLIDQAGETPTPAVMALLIAVLEEAGAAPGWYAAAVRVRAKRMFGDGGLVKAA